MFDITRSSKSFKLIIDLTKCSLPNITIKQITNFWQTIVEECYKENKITVTSATICEGRNIYCKDWGSTEGESVYIITGTLNIHLEYRVEEWVSIVKECAKALMKKLKCSNVFLEIYDTNLTYIEDDGSDK